MALNFSHRPIFPANGCVLEAGVEDRFCNSLLSDGDVRGYFDYGRERCRSSGCPQDSISNDVLDLLPSDPFGMEISTTFTAITGWLEDLELDYGGYGCDMVGGNSGDYQLFAGLKFLWNNAMGIQAFPGSIGFDCGYNFASGTGGYCEAKEAAWGSGEFICGGASEHYGCPHINDAWANSAYLGFESPDQVGGFGSTVCLGVSSDDKEMNGLPCSMDFDSTSGLGGLSEMNEGGNATCIEYQSLGGYDKCSVESGENLGTARTQISINPESSAEACTDVDGIPRLALDLIFASLGVQDLLSVERVCRSLRSMVLSDTLFWRNIDISRPLNEKITDDILLRLTDRAQGHLQCLSLIECTRITDDGLKQVIQSNPGISKVCSWSSNTLVLDISLSLSP